MRRGFRGGVVPAGPWRLDGGRRQAPAVAAVGRSGRAADDELGLEQELVVGDRRAGDLAHQQLDDHPAHRLDRLADRRQRRLGAVHQERVVEADDRDVARDACPARFGGADRAQRHEVAGAHDAGDAGLEQARPRAACARLDRVPGARDCALGERQPGAWRIARAAASLRFDGTWSAGPASTRSRVAERERGARPPAPSATASSHETVREAEAVDRGVDEDGRQLPLARAARSGRAGAASWAYRPPANTIPDTCCWSRRSTYSASETPPAVWVHRTGVKPRCARATPMTSAKAGKIGFWSSGRTRPTSRARSPRSFDGRS